LSKARSAIGRQRPELDSGPRRSSIRHVRRALPW
jgi:hypothetical protein